MRPIETFAMHELEKAVIQAACSIRKGTVLQQRQQQIIAILSSSDGWVRGNEIASKLHVSLRTVQTDICRINESRTTPSIESNTRLGYRLSRTTLPNAKVDQGTSARKTGHNYFEGQIIAALLFEKSWISADTLARRLFVSRSTIIAHLPAVRRIVPRTGKAMFQTATGKGMRIVASERDRRLICIKLLNEDCEYDSFLGVGNFDCLRRDVEELGEVLADIFSDLPRPYTGPAFAMITNFIIVSIMRSCFGFTLPNRTRRCDDPHVKRIANAVLDTFGYSFSVAEECELLSLMESMSLMGCSPRTPRAEAPHIGETKGLVDAFLQSTENLCGIPIRYDAEVRDALEQHIGRMLKRLNSGISYRGRETAKLFSNYPLSVHLLRTCLEPLLGDVHIPDAEVGYLVPYVSYALEKRQPELAILLVTNENVGQALATRKMIQWCADEVAGAVHAVPSYIFTCHSSAYLRDYNSILTTEPFIALQFEQAILIGNFPDYENRNAVRNHILRARKELDLDIDARMRQNYPIEPISHSTVATLSLACATGKAPIVQSALEEAYSKKIEHLTLETVGPCCLSMVSRDDRSSIQYSPCSPFIWKGKRMKEVVFVRYSYDVDPVTLFRYAHRELSRQGYRF